MATVWATHEDVENAWIGEGLPDDPGLIDTWLAKAEREMRNPEGE